MEEIKPDPELTEEQAVLVSQLSKEQIKAIDNALLSKVSAQWQKMANIVGSVMIEHQGSTKGIPDVFYAQRLRKMATDGSIEMEGYISSMRYCEVRENSK